METFSEAQVVDTLRDLVRANNCSKAAALLGISPALVSLVLNGNRRLSSDLALRLGFIRTPDSYMRAPQKKGKR
jgi:plasmid maintenance system antidote protein VapI